MSSNEVSVGEGKAPTNERWPFSTLKKGQYFQCDDLTQHTALRTAASRAKKKLSKVFSVRKVAIKVGGEARTVIRVFLE